MEAAEAASTAGDRAGSRAGYVTWNDVPFSPGHRGPKCVVVARSCLDATRVMVVADVVVIEDAMLGAAVEHAAAAGVVVNDDGIDVPWTVEAAAVRWDDERGASHDNTRIVTD